MKSGDIVQLKDTVTVPRHLIGRHGRIVRVSQRTGSITFAFLETGGGFDKDETLLLTRYEVEPVTSSDKGKQ